MLFSFSFAYPFEEIIQVLTSLIVDTSGANEKSNEAFEARQRLLAWLSLHIGFDISKADSWTKHDIVGGEQAVINDVMPER